MVFARLWAFSLSSVLFSFCMQRGQPLWLPSPVSAYCCFLLLVQVVAVFVSWVVLLCF